MQKGILYALPIVVAAVPAVMLAQSPKAATYITDEEVKAVNATPGIDRTIRVVDIGNENYAVGIIHRGATGGARGAGAGAATGAGAGAARGAAGAAAAARGATGRALRRASRAVNSPRRRRRAAHPSASPTIRKPKAT
jgi:hypothetical protein